MKNVCFVLLSFCVSTALAQDVIVKHDGSTILSKVIKIGTHEVEYKKFSNQNGPTYTIEKAEIMSINYENGDKDVFDNVSPAASTTNSQHPTSKQIETQPDEKNSELIALYNRHHELATQIKQPGKKAKVGCFIMAVDESSVLSNSDIEIRFEQKPYHFHQDGTILSFYFLSDRYTVQIHNKGEKTIFVDLANSFRVMQDGTSYAYYDPSQTAISDGSTTGGSIGLGGVLGGGLLGGASIGASSTATTTKTYAKQRVIGIPPHAKMPLEIFQQVRIKSKKSAIITEGESSVIRFPKNEGPIVNRGEIISYSVNNSPLRAQYTILYSPDENFTSTKTVKATLYAKELFGLKDVIYGKGSPEKITNEIKEIVPDYDDFTIIGEWW